MAKIKRFLVILVSGVGGIILTLSGLNLIQITGDLELYSGIALLVLSLLMYILPENNKKKEV